MLYQLAQAFRLACNLLVGNFIIFFMKIQATIPKIIKSTRYSRQSVELKCCGLLEKLHQRVAKVVKDECGPLKMLVSGGAVPTEWVRPLLQDGLNHYRKTIVMFFDGDMAPAAPCMSTQAFEYSFAWDVALQRMNLYFTWDLPSLSLDVPNFRRDLQSKLAIVSNALCRGIDLGEGDGLDTVTNFVLVTDSEVFVSSYCIGYDDICVIQAFECSANSGRGYRVFTEYQLSAAQAKAEAIGFNWPWIMGSWPVVFERDESFEDTYTVERLGSEEMPLFAPFNTCTPWADDIHVPEHLTHADCLRASLNFVGGHIFEVDSL